MQNILDLILFELKTNYILQLILCIVFILILSILPKVIEAIFYANEYNPTNRPSYLRINPKTNKWESGPISNSTLWWRCFWYSFFN